jgi:hypothetical protein
MVRIISSRQKRKKPRREIPPITQLGHFRKELTLMAVFVYYLYELLLLYRVHCIVHWHLPMLSLQMQIPPCKMIAKVMVTWSPHRKVTNHYDFDLQTADILLQRDTVSINQNPLILQGVTWEERA